MWGSTVDSNRVNTDTPPPAYDADGISSQIEAVIWIESGTGNAIKEACRNEAELLQQEEGGLLATECLGVQWIFDVSPDFGDDEGSLSAGSLVTPDGKQIDSMGAMIRAASGTTENLLINFFAGGEPGSTLRFDTGSNSVGYTTHVYEVPEAEDFLPVYYFD